MQIVRPGEASAPPTASDPLPARMLNEFVYCRRLFYYEYIEGIFLHSADTLKGADVHSLVDQGSGAMPAAKPQSAGEDAEKGTTGGESAEETIHSRSVALGSERLGVTAKLDLVESRTDSTDLFAAIEVCPVDYKAGTPRQGDNGPEIWDADRMQLGLQMLLLRDNGYTCNRGVIYYRQTKQRVPLDLTPELEAWVLEQIVEARALVVSREIPPPLVNSPKCIRCSLAPVCLPDETNQLRRADTGSENEEPPPVDTNNIESKPVRRLMAARDDSRALYLNTQGARVGVRDRVLTVKDKDKLLDEVRIGDVSHVALFGNIQLSTQAVQTLCKEEAPVTYFSGGGWFYGITRGHALANIGLRREQFRAADDPVRCLPLARAFVRGKIRNQRTLIMRNHLQPPEEVKAKMKVLAASALESPSIQELLGTEGAAASHYFGAFGGMLKVADELATGEEGASLRTEQTFFNFDFNGRNRRPPTDPVNALLSLAYSLLSKDCTVALLAVGFDPWLGFYHQVRPGRPALALDLMEEFRPLIADSAVITAINTRMVTSKDFVRAGQAVNLTKDGRKRFFQAYEQRMNHIVVHPVFDYQVSYRRALELQARLLAKTLTGDIPEYIPMMTR
jgi:CRISPR-associated protein Cas1